MVGEAAEVCDDRPLRVEEDENLHCLGKPIRMESLSLHTLELLKYRYQKDEKSAVANSAFALDDASSPGYEGSSQKLDLVQVKVPVTES